MAAVGLGSLVQLLLDVLVFLVTIVVLLVWLIVLSPLYLWRLIVKFLAKCLKSNSFCGMLPPLETFFYSVIETNYDHEPEAVPSLILSMDGHMDFEIFKTNLHEQVLSIKGKDRNLIYDRLQQHVTMWMGYPFFQWDENFDIKDHVFCAPDQYITESTKSSIVMNMARKPFRPNSSPWEFILFPYTEMDNAKTLLVIRAHHIICDGRSILKILTRINGVEESKLFTTVTSSMTTKVSLIEKIKRAYRFNVALPRVFFKELPKLTNPIGIFHKSSTEDREQVLISETGKFPLELFKCLKRDYEAPFTVVLATALSKSLRYLNSRRGEKKGHLDNIQEFHGSMPIPRPKHPEQKLVNHFFLTKLSMVSGEGSPAEMLKLNKDHLGRAGRSILQFAVAQSVFINMICCLPVFISSKFSTETRRAFLISNMPGPNEELSLWNHPISDIMFWIPDVMNFGVTFSVVSYNGFVKIGVSVDSAIAGGIETLDRMVEIIQNELNELFSLVKV